MTNCELLELAAKAAGLWNQWSKYVECVKDHDSDHYGYEGPALQIGSATWNTWNPLDDDGDALRLAVKLKMRIESWGNGGGKIEFNDGKDCILISDNGDIYIATRRAIVHAAAEIGKAMEG